MRDMDDEEAPSERDEQIFEMWQGGKTPRACARHFGVSVTEAERSIDCCLPPFTTQTQMRAFKREIYRLDDVSTYYYTRAMQGDCDAAHVFARVSERRSAVSGWSSVNIRLDPYAAQVKEEPSQHQQIRNAIFRLKYGPQWQPSDSFDANGNLLASPTAPSADDQKEP